MADDEDEDELPDADKFVKGGKAGRQPGAGADRPPRGRGGTEKKAPKGGKPGKK